MAAEVNAGGLEYYSVVEILGGDVRQNRRFPRKAVRRHTRRSARAAGGGQGSRQGLLCGGGDVVRSVSR